MLNKILVLGLVVILTSCVSSPQSTGRISYKRGSWAMDKIEAGEIVRTEYKLQLSKITARNCIFHILYIDFRRKEVTPLYYQVKVVEYKTYDPDAGELLADIIMLPWLPLRVAMNHNLDGTDWKKDEVKTGELIEGETRIEGLIRKSPQVLRDYGVEVLVNGFPFGRYNYKLVDFSGEIRVPSKLIADEYLVQKTVKVSFNSSRFSLQKIMDTKDLEKILDKVYDLGW